MKSRPFLIFMAVCGLSAGARLCAWPPPPAPSPAAFLTSTPTPSPTAAPSPAVTPDETPKPSATPAPSPGPTPTPTPPPPPPAPSPAVSPAPANHAAIEQSALQFEHDWTNAVAKHDLSFIDQAEADEYTYTDPFGTVSHKDDDLARAQVGDIEIESLTFKDEKVHLYGETAVLTGEIDLRGTAKGASMSGNYRWTDVLVQRNGAWQVVASQAVVIEGEDD